MALARERNTSSVGDGLIREIGVKAATKIWAGGIVVNDAGVAAPARTALGLVAIGRAEQTVDNTTGADNAVKVRVRRGVHAFKNKSDDLVVAADIGKDCYLVDDETVAKTSATNTRSIAGKVFSLDGDQVFVEFF